MKIQILFFLFFANLFSQTNNDYTSILLKSRTKIFLTERANKVIFNGSIGDTLKIFNDIDLEEKSVIKVLFFDGNNYKWGWIQRSKSDFVTINQISIDDPLSKENKLTSSEEIPLEIAPLKDKIKDLALSPDKNIKETSNQNQSKSKKEESNFKESVTIPSNLPNQYKVFFGFLFLILGYSYFALRKKNQAVKTERSSLNQPNLKREHKKEKIEENKVSYSDYSEINSLEISTSLDDLDKALDALEKVHNKKSIQKTKLNKNSKKEIIDRAFNKYLDNLIKESKVSKSLNGIDQETKIKWFDFEDEDFESFQWYGKLNRRNTQIRGIDELKKEISTVDLPIRFSSKDQERDFSEIAVLRSLSDTFRKVRFLVQKLKIDYFSTEKIDDTDTLPVTDIASFTKRMSDDEQKIWDKNVNFSYKVSKVRSFDYLTFKKLDSEEVMIKSSYRKSIGIESHNFIKWLKNVYPKYSNLSKKEIGSGQRLFHRFFTNQNDYLAYMNNPSKRYSFLFSVDKECAICRNDISDYHYHFYFCPVCIHLVDFKSFNKEFLKYQRSGIERDFNGNNHCIFNDCNKTSNSGYFCNNHKKTINQLLNHENKNIFDIPDQSSDDFNRSASLIHRQGKLFNQLILKAYLNNRELDLEKLFDIINNSNAIVSSKEECFNMIISLLLLDEKHKEAVDFYYKVLDLIDLTEYLKPDKSVGKSSQIEFIKIDHNLAEMLKQIIINNQYDFHTFHAFEISSASIHSKDWSSLRFNSSRIKYDYAQEFAEKFLKRLNENKDFIYKNFPYDYTYHFFDDKKKLWYRLKEEDYYGGTSEDRKVVKHDKDYESIDNNANEIIKIIMKSLPDLPEKYFHDGLPRPIKYPYYYDGGAKFRIYQKIDGSVSLKEKDSYYWKAEYDLDSYFIDEDIFEKLNELNNENSPAFWLVDRVLLTSDKVFRLMDIDKEKAIIFREKLIKKYFNTLSPEYCLSRRYSNHYYRSDYGNRKIYESSIDNDIKWVEKIIELQDGIEDQIREKYNIPASQWISEHRLYEQIKESFPDEKVVKHGRPKWLKQQHLDIYLPDRNIAIEYQGDQHLMPVEFFGGEEGFKKTLERDERKKKLCLKNNCYLIYAYPEDNFEDIVNQISKKIF